MYFSSKFFLIYLKIYLKDDWCETFKKLTNTFNLNLTQTSSFGLDFEKCPIDIPVGFFEIPDIEFDIGVKNNSIASALCDYFFFNNIFYF
jgi:hypothetical protein